MKTLIMARDDLSLESFCVLVSMFGQDLEKETNQQMLSSIPEVQAESQRTTSNLHTYFDSERLNTGHLSTGTILKLNFSSS
jgi:hypothetical protein